MNKCSQKQNIGLIKLSEFSTKKKEELTLFTSVSIVKKLTPNATNNGKSRKQMFCT